MVHESVGERGRNRTFNPLLVTSFFLCLREEYKMLASGVDIPTICFSVLSRRTQNSLD